MPHSLTMKQDDTGAIAGTVAHAAGQSPPPLQNCSSLKLYARQVIDPETLELAAANSIDGEDVDSFNDDGTFTWVPETDYPVGMHKCYALATYADATEIRFPNRGYFKLVIEQNFEP